MIVFYHEVPPFHCPDNGPRRSLMACDVRSSMRGTTSGTWTCSAGRFVWDYGQGAEVLYILSGNARIRDVNGDAWHYVGVGSSVHFPKGCRAEWEVPDYVRKFWVIHLPLYSRILNKRPMTGT
jgi:uncharacterized cupin superfamily protein